MVDHTVNVMDRDLSSIANKIEEMGSLALEMLAAAISSFVDNDAALARSVVAIDRKLDFLHHQVQEFTVLVIARRQPVGSDLREALGAMRISGELERIGDLSKNIANRSIATSNSQFLPTHTIEFRKKADVVSLQLRNVLDAYNRRDEWRAEAVWLRNLNHEANMEFLSNNLVSAMIKNPRDITALTHLLFCSKNIDNIISHSVNIAEIVHYIITGEMFNFEKLEA